MTESIPYNYPGPRQTEEPGSLLADLRHELDVDQDCSFASGWNAVVEILRPRKIDAEQALVMLAAACSEHVLPERLDTPATNQPRVRNVIAAADEEFARQELLVSRADVVEFAVAGASRNEESA